MPSNLAGSSGDVQKRQFFLQGTDLSTRPNPFHQATLPAVPGSPAAPVFPDTLTAAEQDEVNRWLSATQSDRPNVFRRLATRAAVEKVVEFESYYADPAIIAWLAAVEDARWAQPILVRADALINNEDTTSISSDPTGAGASPPDPYQPPGTNTP